MFLCFHEWKLTKKISNKLLIGIGCFILFLWIYSAYGELFFSGDLVGTRDQFYQDTPLRVLAGQFWRKGEVPLWNPYTFMGEPLAGQIYVGVFSPHILFYVIFKPRLAHKLMWFYSHLILALGLWLWFRERRVRPDLAFLFMLVGTILPTRWYTLSFTGRDTFIYFPLILWSTEKYLKNEKFQLKYFFITVCVWSTSFLAGHTQLWFYMVIVAGFMALLTCVIEKSLLIRIGILIIVFLFIVSPQIVATLPLAEHSHRLKTNFCLEQYKTISPTFELFFKPFKTKRDYYFANAYISPFLFLLALSYVFSMRRERWREPVFVSLVLLMGGILGGTTWPCSLPVFRNMRNHTRFDATSFLIFLVLYGGYELYRAMQLREKDQKRWLFQFLILLLWFGIFLIRMPGYTFLDFIRTLEVVGILLFFSLALFFKKRRTLFLLFPLFLLLVQQMSEYRILVQRDLSINSWKKAEQYQKALKPYLKYGTVWYAPWHQGEPWTGIEANLNVFLPVYQMNSYPGAVSNPVITNIPSILVRWYPHILPLFGVDAIVLPAFYQKRYNLYRLESMVRKWKLPEIFLQDARGCFAAPNLAERKGWMITHEKSKWWLWPDMRTGDRFAIQTNVPENVEFLPVCPRSENGNFRVVKLQEKVATELIEFSRTGRIVKTTPLPEKVRFEPARTVLASENGRLVFYTIRTGKVHVVSWFPDQEVVSKNDSEIEATDIMPFMVQYNGQPSAWVILRSGKAVFLHHAKRLEVSEQYHLTINFAAFTFYQFIVLKRNYLEPSRWWKKIAVLSDTGFEVYRLRKGAFPFAWSIAQVTYQPWSQFEKSIVLSSLPRWKREGIVSSPQYEYEALQSPEPRVLLKERHTNSFTIHYEGGERILVMRVLPYPCWEFRVDGVRVESFPVNYVMTAIRVNEGKHRIEARCTLSSLYRYTFSKTISFLNGS